MNLPHAALTCVMETRRGAGLHSWQIAQVMLGGLSLQEDLRHANWLTISSVVCVSAGELMSAPLMPLRVSSTKTFTSCPLREFADCINPPLSNKTSQGSKTSILGRVRMVAWSGLLQSQLRLSAGWNSPATTNAHQFPPTSKSTVACATAGCVSVVRSSVNSNPVHATAVCIMCSGRAEVVWSAPCIAMQSLSQRT